jgi:probable F420-dependent oxidoreductase
MRFGMHLPQSGHASGADSIRQVAQLAESCGFDDVWVSDHIVVPEDQGYPTPYIHDALLTLAWAASATTSVGLGTAVLVVPQYHPVQLANSLATLDSLSGGRLLIGAGVGWSKGEFDALGQDFSNRGRRMDEIVPLLRACWDHDPVSYDGKFYRLDRVRMQPKPAHRIPIWIGGTSEAAMRRACALGDGYQTIGKSPEEVPDIVRRIRADRPEQEFTISLRTGWDAVAMDHDLIRAERESFEASGIQHVVSAPWRRELSEYLEAVEQLAGVLGLPRQ